MTNLINCSTVRALPFAFVYAAMKKQGAANRQAILLTTINKTVSVVISCSHPKHPQKNLHRLIRGFLLLHRYQPSQQSYPRLGLHLGPVLFRDSEKSNGATATAKRS